MPDIKEKPQMGKPKARNHAAMLPKQTARLMKEKYIKELDQRPEGGNDTNRAPDQVEKMGRWAVDELAACEVLPMTGSYAPLDTPLCSCRGYLPHLGLSDFSCPNMKPSHRFNCLSTWKSVCCFVVMMLLSERHSHESD